MMRLLGVVVLCLSLPSLALSQGERSKPPTNAAAAKSFHHVLLASAFPTQSTKVALTEKPSPTDKDSAGRPKYSTYEDYIEALVDWKVLQRVSAAGKDVLILPDSDSQRFQIVFNPNVRADTFLLDTKTGRVWRNTAFTDLEGSPDVWVYMDRADNDEEVGQWAARRLKKQK